MKESSTYYSSAEMQRFVESLIRFAPELTLALETFRSSWPTDPPEMVLMGELGRVYADSSGHVQNSNACQLIEDALDAQSPIRGVVAVGFLESYWNRCQRRSIDPWLSIGSRATAYLDALKEFD